MNEEGKRNGMRSKLPPRRGVYGVGTGKKDTGTASKLPPRERIGPTAGPENENETKKYTEENEDNDEQDTKSKLSFWDILLFVVVTVVLAVLAGARFGILGLLTVLILALTIVTGYYSMYVYFAPRKLIFAGVREGTARAIMVGTKEDPKFVRLVMSFKGHDLDKNWNVVPVKRKKKGGLIEFIESRFSGLVFVGIPGIDWIWEYKFKWTSMEEDEKGEKPVTKEKTIDYIYVKSDVYVETLKGAEVGLTMVPVDIILFITARVINPYKALFRVERWLEYIMNRVKVPIRDYMGKQKGPAELITSKENLGIFLYKKLEESGAIKDFLEVAGILIEHMETPGIDLGKFQEIATAEWEAEQRGKAEIKKQEMEGIAYKKKKGLLKEADMDYLGGVYSKIMEFGDKGLVMRFLDSLTDAAKGPSNTIIPFGFVENIARQVLGRETAGGSVEFLKEMLGENITKEDIEQLKEFIKKKKSGGVK